MPTSVRPCAAASAPHPVDNTDWLKAAAIVLVFVDHFGHFFMKDDRWWSVFGRLAAPTFFFLLGFAQRRTVPLHWILLGIILTLLNSWNARWTWVAPNILLSLAVIRIARPYVQVVVQRHGWTAFVLLVCALVALLPVAANLVDYGAEGWLWALFGLYQRIYVERPSGMDVDGASQGPAPPVHAIGESVGLERLLACLVAAAVYIWQEQKEYSFRPIYFGVFIFGVAVLCVMLCLFRRGPSKMQPPEVLAAALRFMGRHTLEIYAIQLAGSEVIVKLFPHLAA